MGKVDGASLLAEAGIGSGAEELPKNRLQSAPRSLTVGACYDRMLEAFGGSGWYVEDPKTCALLSMRPSTSTAQRSSTSPCTMPPGEAAGVWLADEVTSNEQRAGRGEP